LPTTDQAALKHFEKIATPLRLAQSMAPQVMGRPYKPYPWVQLVEKRILEMLSRPGREVFIVSVPPQQGKSTYALFWFPNWYIGLNPDNQVIAVAYSDDYVGSWGRRVRDFVDMHGENLFGVTLNKSEQSVNNWKTQRGFGGMLSAGINGGITGNPGHLILIDDIVKNMQEALSPASKRMHLNEWDGSISARLQEDTKIVITATRWAEDDLSGEIIARAQTPGYDGIPVSVLPIKAIAEPDEAEELSMTEAELEEWRDPLGRRRGESLEGQHSPGFFREKKASVGGYTWSSLYQASPSARKGSMFPPDRWQWYDPTNYPEMQVVRRIWDIAATEEGGDYTAGALVGKDVDGHWYVLDVQRAQLATADVKALVKSTAVSDSRAVPIRMEREKAGAGKAQIATYKVDMMGWDFDECKGEGAKLDRFGPYSVEQQDRKVHLPRFADGSSPPWVEAFIAEHRMQMPDGRGPKNDDQIDVVAYAILEMYDLGPVEISDPNENYDPDALIRHESIAEEHGIYETYSDMPDHLARLMGRAIDPDLLDEDPVGGLVG
jgi:predicted phage terminase large subunit-like protein